MRQWRGWRTPEVSPLLADTWNVAPMRCGDARKSEWKWEARAADVSPAAGWGRAGE